MPRLYLKVEGGIHRHPKVLRLVEVFQLPELEGPDLVVGFLMRWWHYCAEYAGGDGKPADCPRNVLRDLARALLGKSAAVVTPDLVQTLREARLMDQHGRPWDWQDYTGALLARRAKDAERKRKLHGRSVEAPREIPRREEKSTHTDLSLHTEAVVQEKPEAKTQLVVQGDALLQAGAARRETKEAALEHAAKIVFGYWRDTLGWDPKRTMFAGKRKARIITRLRENNGDVSTLLYAVDGALRDDWIMGRDARSTKTYKDTSTVFRDLEQVEKLAAQAKNRQDHHPYLGEAR